MTASLNKAQHTAVTADDGPALVLAGAGSGKTLVIVERLVWLVEERGVDPRNLLALTFTNKAAGEMKSRVAKRLGVDRLSAWIGTFHSFGLFILRREIDRLDRKKSFTIFDDSDQLSLMKRLVKDLSGKWEKVSPREALTRISQYKQKLSTPDPEEIGTSLEEETYFKLWGQYHDQLIRASAVDFDDLIVLPAKLLDQHEDIRAKYQRRYRYVLIDEYQDTNHAQYWIAKRLSEGHGNIFAVGDEDQGIYSWRGADINNIIDFEKDFPKAVVYRLERNYRSTKPILDVANAVVANNMKRIGKSLWTEENKGDPVTLYEATDGKDEARFVAEKIMEDEYLPVETAVLYRTNAQARLMEEELRRKGIAYKVVGGIKFYARKEIKDIIAYLRLLVNPGDGEAVRRIINVPRRGIGSETLRKLQEAAQLRDCSLFQVLCDIETDQMLTPRMRQQIIDFVHMIDDLTMAAKSSQVEEIVEQLLEKTQYRDYVAASDEKDFKSRLEIVDEFVSACCDFDQNDTGGVLEFLQELSLLSDVDSLDEELPAVTLMTCHSAKGLEFDCVFLIGLEEGLLPHSSSLYEEDEIEEERRLCYVAMTRARKQLYLAAASSRLIYGEDRRFRPSRFISEIPKGLLVRSSSRISGGVAVPRQQVSRDESAKIKSGTRVRHATFGTGYVLYTKGKGSKMRAKICFDAGRSREFLIEKAPLEILEKRR